MQARGQTEFSLPNCFKCKFMSSFCWWLCYLIWLIAVLNNTSSHLGENIYLLTQVQADNGHLAGRVNSIVGVTGIMAGSSDKLTRSSSDHWFITDTINMSDQSDPHPGWQWSVLFVILNHIHYHDQWSYLGWQTSDSASSSKFHHLALLALLVALVSSSSNFHHWPLLALLVALVLH